MTRKKDSLTTYKTCPRCKGTGRVTCDGRDHIRQKYLAWAWSHHMKPVTYRGDKETVPGIAVAGINPGGWSFLDIYVARIGGSIRDAAGHFNNEVGVYIYVKRRRKRGEKLEYENFLTIDCRGPEMDRVAPLDIWPEHLMLLPANYELDDGSLLQLSSVQRLLHAGDNDAKEVAENSKG